MTKLPLLNKQWGKVINEKEQHSNAFLMLNSRSINTGGGRNA